MPQRNVAIIFLSALVSLVCYQKADRNRDAAIIYEAINTIDRTYYEPVERRTLFEGALRGMVRELDEHSAYFSPNDFVQVQQSLDQEFGGVGIVVELDVETRRLTVLSPLVGTPAHRAGMRAGDVILEIDGQSTVDMDLPAAVRLMRGRKGVPVQLSVQHAGDEEPVEFNIVRDIIPIESVLGDTRNEDGSWNYVLEDHPHIGYVRLTTFGERTHDELKKALEFDKPVSAVVLDVRDNAGGLLQTAIEVCDLFIKKGRIVSTRGRGGVLKSKSDATSQVALDPDLPVVVLTNRFSASASEILAACLQDHARAVVVGERTWGKGTVQNIVNLESGRSALKLTTASYWRPNGKNIHRRKDATEEDDWGVQPDDGFEVSLTDEQYARLVRFRRDRDLRNLAEVSGQPPPPSEDPSVDDGETAADDDSRPDPQLEKAIEHLNSLLGSQRKQRERA